MVNYFSPETFFNIDDERVSELFKDVTHVWEAVAALPAYIERIIKPEVLGEVEEGAWLEPGCVQLGRGSRVERGAIIRGPTIIGENTTIRSAAYIRGHLWVGSNCLIGHGVELRQLLVLNNSNIPHLNCIFTSIIGNRVKIGGTASTANFRLDGNEIVVRAEVDGQKQSFSTGLTLLGAVIGDDTHVGGNALLHPGTIIGRRCLIYPQCSVSGYIAPDRVVKPRSAPFEVYHR
jgi:NDP-sugar pyrophosphorylase family protein